MKVLSRIEPSDVGIAEAHAVTFAGRISQRSIIPFLQYILLLHNELLIR